MEIKFSSFWLNGDPTGHKIRIFVLGWILFCSTLVSAQEVVDLGVVGNVCAVSLTKIRSNHNKYLKQSISINKEAYLHNARKQLSVAYDGTKKLNQGGIEGYQYQLKDRGLSFDEKRIYVFSALDAKSIEVAKRLKADIGICIEYRSLEDIESFRQQTGIKYPIKLGNDNVIHLLRIKSYPALLIIKDGEVTVETNI